MVAQHMMIAVFVVVLAVVFPSAFGHGVGYETLPPQLLGDRQVAMEVSSNTDSTTGQKQILFSLFDTGTKVTIGDVKYNLKAIKNGSVLFEEIYESKNGVLSLVLVPNDSGKITTMKKSEGGFFDSLIGIERNTLEASGKALAQGGLYKFSITILEAGGYSGKSPVTFESGISFPASTVIEVDDEHFGRQKITQTSYYDTITGLDYDAKTKSIIFSMPFEWTPSNILQTSVVHQEVVIPKTFGTLQVSEYTATVNGHILPENAITIDDFQRDARIVHLLLYTAEVAQIYEMQQNHDTMNFVLSPKSDDMTFVGTTDNIQYKIAVTTDPKHLRAGDDATVSFQIYDIFLSGKTVSTTYELTLESNGNTFYKTRGTSTGEKTKWDQIKLMIPKEASDKLTIRFESLGGNNLAKAEIPIALSLKIHVPLWVKSNADWWCNGSISEGEFLSAIEYLIKKNIIEISDSQISHGEKEMPPWIRDNACRWSDDSISDSEFMNGITFLVKNGLIVP